MSDAAKKHKRLERILKVQTQKREIEEWSLNHLRRQRAEIDQADADILQSLATSSELHGMFTEAKVKSLRRNDVVRRENEARQKDGETRLSEARRREKGVERQYGMAGREALADEEANALDSHVEGFLARLANSLG